MVVSLDAKEILSYLNDMGYRNISSSQLKEFMIDLRKLIKYEEELCRNSLIDNISENAGKDSGRKIYELSTKKFKNISPDMQKPKISDECRAQEIKNERHSNINSLSHIDKNSTAKETRSKSGFKSSKQNNPVELYHYYKKQWERYKKNFPGENSHSNLRHSIRRRLSKNEGNKK